MNSNKDFYILIEHGDLEEFHLALVSEARKLADELGEEVCCVAMGGIDNGTAGELAHYGADRIYPLDGLLPSKYCAETAEIYIDVLSSLLKLEMPRKLLCADNWTGTDVACRLGARMKVGLITGCVDLSFGRERLAIHGKPIFEGRLIGNFTFPHPSFEIVTIKPGALEKKSIEVSKKPEIVTIRQESGHGDARVKTIGMEKADPDSIGLDEAEVIISGGRGMGSIDNFRLLEGLAKLLGGVVAGSLGAVDEGWVPRKKLVGQTGTTVEPKIYIACGVSGSIYHLLGMRDSKAIVAINKDCYAPIFKCADFGIVGDVMEVIPSMLDRLKGLEQASASKNGVSDA